MKKRKLIYSLALLVVIFSAATSVCAGNGGEELPTELNLADTNDIGLSLEDPLSPALQIIANENPMILCGVNNEGIRFSADAFNEHNGYIPSSITILSLPESENGKLIYNSTPVTVGQSISVLSISSLYYSPNISDDAEFTFSPDNTCSIKCILRNKDINNNDPVASKNCAVNTTTRLDTVVSGYLDGYDVDGDSFTYEIVSAPEKGNISIINKENGQFLYHPYSGKSGADNFTYRIRDSYGAYSSECRVDLSINNSKATIYSDLKNSYYASAVNDVVECGIMKTETIDNNVIFMPDEPVSRIDFLIMSMKTLGADVPEEVSVTPFYDDTTLTDLEKGYLCAAYSLGIVKGSDNNGMLMFMPDDPVTGASAAVMLNCILGLNDSGTVQTSAMSENIPVWASPSFSALSSAGIINSKYISWDSILSRENTAVILSCVMNKMN